MRSINLEHNGIAKKGDGAQGLDRTADTSIFNAVLYHLSYLGIKIRQKRTHKAPRL